MAGNFGLVVLVFSQTLILFWSIQAVRWFISNKTPPKDHELLLSDKEIDALVDIRQILEIPHAAQELLSGEKAPTITYMLPVYEDLIDSLRILQTTIPEASYAIQAGITKLEEYVSRARKSRIHALSMSKAFRPHPWYLTC